MAQIYRTPTKEQVLKEASDELRETLTKMLDIYDILFKDPPSDKKFNKRYMDYFTEFSTILFQIESDNARYTDEYITKAINNLYDKIFKHRRY